MNENFMNEAITESKENSKNNYKSGGPFGAVIVKNGEIIARGHNTVIETKDPTAHAEVNTIRAAAKALSTHDLTGCTLYVNAEPCPMCLSAIIWANIKEVYYANTKKDAADIGFRDDAIYEYIKGNNLDTINIHHIDSKDALQVFEEFKNNDNKIMY
jgi:tRNA(Arg) A34 adenosine deaminase TadA